jgi:hypothetical protein
VSGIKYLLNRLHTYPITKKSKQTEKKHTTENEYNINVLEKPLSQPQKKKHGETKHQKTKSITFTYCRKEVKTNNKVF